MKWTGRFMVILSKGMIIGLELHATKPIIEVSGQLMELTRELEVRR